MTQPPQIIVGCRFQNTRKKPSVATAIEKERWKVGGIKHECQGGESLFNKPGKSAFVAAGTSQSNSTC